MKFSKKYENELFYCLAQVLISCNNEFAIKKIEQNFIRLKSEKKIKNKIIKKIKSKKNIAISNNINYNPSSKSFYHNKFIKNK